MADFKSRIENELLIIDVYEGDREAFNQLVTLWNKKLVYQSYLRVNDMEQAQDIVQDVWQWLVGNRRKLQNVENFSSWIRTIVDRRSVDWLRKERNFNLKKEELNQTYGNPGDTIGADAADNSDASEGSERSPLELMRMALRYLKADLRLIVNLYYLEGESINSISKILDIPPGTVKSRLFTAREKLKSVIKKH